MKKTIDELQIPHPVSEYIVRTLNNKGPVSRYICEYAQKFIDDAATQNGPVLELGAAYGFVTIAALQAGAQVIANDLEPKHLSLLEQNTPEACRARLTLLPGEFPFAFDLPPESLHGCYTSRMLGYLKPETMQLGFEKIFVWLKKQARFFILASSPYRKIGRRLIPVYEQRVQDNIQWPGYFTDFKSYVIPKVVSRTPNTMHFLDDKILSRELQQVGFVIETAQYYPRVDIPPIARLDGREGVVIIARKP